MQNAAVQRSYIVAKSLPTTFFLTTQRCYSDRYSKFLILHKDSTNGEQSKMGLLIFQAEVQYVFTFGAKIRRNPDMTIGNKTPGGPSDISSAALPDNQNIYNSTIKALIISSGEHRASLVPSAGHSHRLGACRVPRCVPYRLSVSYGIGLRATLHLWQTGGRPCTVLPTDRR